MKRILLAASLVILLLAGAAAWWWRAELAGWCRLPHPPVGPAAPAAPRPRPDDYQALIEDARRWRQDLLTRYRAARDEPARNAVLAETRAFLETLLPAMMRCWLGTPWDFHGTAEQPGPKAIACGYFVATVLRDAGFRIDRFKVAQQPSETILRTFLPRRALLYRVGVPYQEFAAEARRLEPGVHLIGLDTHVAFLVAGNGSFRFLHASGSRPWCVVDEPPDHAPVLAKSSFRVLGNLTADDELLRRWLAGSPLPAGGR